MASPRIFIICHVVEKTRHDSAFVMHLVKVLRASGAEVALENLAAPDMTLWQSFNNALVNSEWLIFVQTPAAVSSQQVQLLMNTALNRVPQRVLRVIVESRAAQELPQAWLKSPAFDVTRDSRGALESLLRKLGLQPPQHQAATSQMPLYTSPLRTRPLSSMPKSTQSQPAVSSSAARPTQSQPVIPPKSTQSQPAVSSSVARPTQSWPIITPSSSPPSLLRRRRAVLSSPLLLSLLVLILFGVVMSSFFLLVHHDVAATPQQLVGRAFFVSSEQTSGDSSQGISDELQIELQHIQSPAAGHSLYAWLLPDNDQSHIPALFLGQLSVKNGKSGLFFPGTKQHTNLLEMLSRVLIVELPTAAATPALPTDHQAWRYLGQVPQIPGKDGPMHASMLDHLRHLLAEEPMQETAGIHGGINERFLENTRKVLEWSNAVKGDWGKGDPGLLRRQLIRILDYIDGAGHVQQDVGPNIPLLADPTLSRIPLLDANASSMSDTAYVPMASMHLTALVNTPGATAEQRQVATQIVQAVGGVKGWLEQVRTDARQLYAMSDDQLAQQKALMLANDMATQANYAYVGRFDPTAPGGMRQGVVWIHTQIQLLASVPIELYVA